MTTPIEALPFAVFDEFGVPCDDRVQDHYHRAAADKAEPAPEFCCAHSWEAAKMLAWKERDTNCDCDHIEYCARCYPLDFRPGGKWSKYRAAPQAQPPAAQDPK